MGARSGRSSPVTAIAYGRALGLVLLAIVTGLGFAVGRWFATAPSPRFRAPGPADYPPGVEGELAQYGRQLIDETNRHVGPGAADPALRLAGNNLTCGACHLDSGARRFGLPLVSSFASFPRYLPDGSVMTLANRINQCMTRSMNGRPLPESSRGMAAFIAYIKLLGRGTPIGVEFPGTGIPPLPDPAQPPDGARGRVVYAQYCATCHRPDGLGERRGPTDTDGYTVTPLWGPDSFNAAAGMARLPTAAAFVRANMPYGVTANEPLLSAQQAWDVAAYMLAQPRPNLAP